MHQRQEHAAEAPPLLADRRERLITRILFCAGVILLAALPIYVAVARGKESTVHPGTLQLAGVRGRNALLVVFQPRDCRGYQGFIDAMATLAQKGLPVVGIPVNAPSDPESLRASLGGLAPGFPLAPDAADDAVRLLRGLGYTDTPIALVVDPGGRLAMTAQPQSTPYDQGRMTELLERYLSMPGAGVAAR